MWRSSGVAIPRTRPETFVMKDSLAVASLIDVPQPILAASRSLMRIEATSACGLSTVTRRQSSCKNAADDALDQELRKE